MLRKLLIAVVITVLLTPMVFAGAAACACCASDPVAVESDPDSCCASSDSEQPLERPAPSSSMPHFCTCEAGTTPQPTPLATITSAPRVDTGKTHVFVNLGHELSVSAQSNVSPSRVEVIQSTTSPPASYVVNCAFLR